METTLVLIAGLVVGGGIVLELLRFSPRRDPTRRAAIAWSIGWLALSGAMAATVALTGGPAGAWTTVYLIERSLSLDNVFVFSLLLATLAVPATLRGRVVAIGVAGALVLRGLAIVAGIALIEAIDPVVYVFGAVLLLVAYRTFRGSVGAQEDEPTESPGLARVRRVLPGASPLLLAGVSIVVADIAFAVDSIPAALAVTRDSTVIWTANAFALLGLGALLALVDILVRRFRYLGRTIALVLAFVGASILLADVVEISDVATLGVIAAILAGGIVASLAADRRDPPTPEEHAARRPPRCSGMPAPAPAAGTD